jgi:VCBS repeat-containing protein/autotransporter-associated beta strand protein
VTVNSDGALSVEPISGTSEVIGALTVKGGDVRVGSGLTPSSVAMTGGVIQRVGGAGSLNLAGDVTASGGAEISAPVSLNDPARVFDVAPGAAPDLTISGVISDGGLHKVGDGTMLITSTSTYSGVTNADVGVLQIGTFGGAQGSVPQSPASIANSPVQMNGAILAGYGTTGPVTSLAGGQVSPGGSPGILTTGSISWNPNLTFTVEIQGNYAGGPAGYDQDNVQGTVSLGGAVLSVTTLSPSTAAVGDAPYVIINNDGVDPINGRFTLPDGTVLQQGEIFAAADGGSYRINYFGGDGNDVTIQAVAAPVATDDFYAFPENDPTTIPFNLFNYVVPAPGVLGNDINPNVASPPAQPYAGLQVVVISGPANGSLTMKADGSFTYIPNPGYVGTDTGPGGINPPDDSFTYRATTGEVLVDDLTFAIDTTLPNGIFFPAGTTIPAGQLDPRFFSNLATVDIEINAVAAAPVSQADFYTVDSITASEVSGDGSAGNPRIFQLTVPAPGVLANDYSPENFTTPPGPAVTLSAILVDGPSHGLLVGGLSSDGGFTYQPNVGFVGSDTFQYQVVDSNGLIGPVTTVTLTVMPLNNLNPVGSADTYNADEDTTLFVGPSGVLANDFDPEGSPLTAVNVTQPIDSGTGNPAGQVTLNPDGSFSYVPPINYSGTVTFTYQAFDGTHSSDPITVTITVVQVPDSPVAVNNTYSVLEDLQLTVDATDSVLLNDIIDPATTADVVAVLIDGPDHGTIDLSGFAANGTFTYTPDLNFNGQDSFRYYLLNTATQQASGPATVFINVVPVNDPPVANNDLYVTNEDVKLTVAAPGVLANDTDIENDPLTAVLASLPAHGIVTLNPDGSFTYTPNDNFFGIDTFTYFAFDGKTNSATPATVTITVNPIVDAPTTADDSFSVLEDKVLTVNTPGILVNDTNLDDPTFGTSFANTQIVVLNGPLHGTLGGNITNGGSSNNGSFTYTPDANFFGTDSFTYFIRNTLTGATSNISTVTIHVVSVPDLPVGNPDTFTTNEDVPLHVAGPGVLKNDVNVDKDTLSAVVIDGPSHGSVLLNSDGSFTYTPDANFNGTDTFTYVPVNGAGQGNTTTVTINVRPVNDRPVAIDDTYTMEEDDTLVVPPPGVLGNDTDAEGNDITAVLVNDVQNGKLTLNADGSFTYVPNADFVGTDSFTYRAFDGELYSNLAKVTINVQKIAPTTINLDPNSDTGVSNSDGITKDNTPTFFGTTRANLQVKLYVRPWGSGATPMQVGTTTADSQGNWRITSNLLPDGHYEVLAAAFRPNGQSTGQVISFGELTVDTVAPRVDAAVLSPKTGQVYISFQDNMSGMAQPNIGNAANYSFAKIYTHAPRAFAVNTATPLPSADPTAPQTVVLDVFGGRGARHGRYLFAALSGEATPNGQGGISDVAGNALDGEFSGNFPSGNGQAGGDFDAQFNTNGNDITIAAPATEFVPYFTSLKGNAPSISFNLARTPTRIINGQGQVIPGTQNSLLGAAGRAAQLRASQLRARAVGQATPAGAMSLAGRRFRG